MNAVEELFRGNQTSCPLLASDMEVLIATNAFDEMHPLASSKNLTADRILWPLRAVAQFSGICLVHNPALMLEVMTLSSFGLFGIISAWRLGLMVMGLCVAQRNYSGPDALDIYPVYTVLLPLYKEARILPQLCVAMHAQNYPSDRLDIILLVEANDRETLIRAKRLLWPENTRIIIVPSGKPQTKPRALNVGLQYAKGSFLTIFDAEDRPHPNQLRKAVRAFMDPNTGCVQAPLCADGSAQNWLGAHWALEYSLQFGLLQPALAHCGLPIMLGGTSNHFRTDMLRRIGGWDAWNVTEDAELGLRFARAGLKIKTIPYPTLEKPPNSVRIWLGQRSRWLKGYMQTWVTYCRSQKEGGSHLNLLERFSICVLLAGTILSAFAFLPGILFVGLGLATGTLNVLLSVPLFVMLVFTAILGLVAPGSRHGGRAVCALTQCFYWPLHTIAACLALKCFIKSPSFWNKTMH